MSAPDARTASAADEATREPEPAPELVAGQLVGRYRLKRRLGAGGMGEVYLAQDLELGRVAALKFVRPDRVSGARRERLLHEARLTARLSHPHIVSVYELGFSGPLPFIALEYLEGQTLAERIAEHRPSVAQALRMGHAIVSALAHAHAHAVVHRDLKPANVMLPRDGRLRVVDFGLAMSAGSGPVPAAREGTWRFMAPEQRRGDALTPAADLYAFGVLMLQLVCELPPPDDQRAAALRARLPADVARLIERCLDEDPARRPTAADLAESLDPLQRGRRKRADDENPYPGLLPFDEDSSDFFFGRDDEIDALLEAVRVTPWVSLLGASGVGKSSLVRAGVLPRLVREGGWRALVMRPGRDPLGALARALIGGTAGGEVAINANDVDALVASARAQPARAGAAIVELARRAGEQWVLFVDQLEELVTNDVSPSERETFFAVLTAAARDASDPFRILTSVRDDFAGHFPGLPGARIVGSLSAESLLRAVVRPMALSEHTLDDPTLAAEMVREAGERPGALPLLQFACAQLWLRRDLSRRMLTRAAYVEMGGVAGALARHADRVLGELRPEQRAVARPLLLRLVGPEGTRVERTRGELVDGLGAPAVEVLQALVAQRLLAVVSTAGEDAKYEVAHEALIRSWETLVRWREDARVELRWAREVDDAARLWDRRGRPDKETWPESALADARRHLDAHEELLSPVARAFLRAGTVRALAGRRTQRLLVTAGVTLMLLLTLLSIAAAVEFRRREKVAEALQIAAGDVGYFSLEIPVFDWDPATREAPLVDPRKLPFLQLDLRALPLRRSEHDPGLPPRPTMHIHSRTLGARGWVFEIEATAGPAALIVRGRGRTGETCAPSTLRLAALPGYNERDSHVHLEVRIPSCRATRADGVEIAAGPFVFQGPGDPPALDVRGVLPEQVIVLPRYWVDRTEVTNALFAQLARSSTLTGYPAPDYPDSGFMAVASRPDFPVVSINAFTADSFCRFMGKRLPTTQEWEKALRGGLTLDERGRLNLAPKRIVPWAFAGLAGRLNMLGTEDGWDVSAPVGSYPGGASPYGILDLLGNAEEWTATPTRDIPNGALRVSRGGNWDDGLSTGHLSAILEVDRNPHYFDYALGVRCVADE